MSRKVPNEKEIEKARWERKWPAVLRLVPGFSAKNVTSLYSADELDLFRSLHVAEAVLEQYLESACVPVIPGQDVLLARDLTDAYSPLTQAAGIAQVLRDKYPLYYQDVHLLLAKYYYVTGDFQQCINSVQKSGYESAFVDGMPRRSRYILVESLACKGLSIESLTLADVYPVDAIKSYCCGSDIAMRLFADDEVSGTLKRSSATGPPPDVRLSPLLETCIVRPGELFLYNGKPEEAVAYYRAFLSAVESRATLPLRKVVARRLAEVLLSCTCTSMYIPPSAPLTPADEARQRGPSVCSASQSSPDVLPSALKSIGKRSTSDSVFTPRDILEESLLVLLLSEAMSVKGAVVSLFPEESAQKEKVLNETNLVFDLLTFALSRREQYALLCETLEKSLKLAFDEFQIWFQFALSLIASAKFSRALLAIRHCQDLQPTNVEVKLFGAKLCINYLRQYEDALGFAESVLHISDDDEVLALAYLAVGIANSHLSTNAATHGESQRFLKHAVAAFQKAHLLNSSDVQIMFHLSLAQGMAKQIPLAISTVRQGLAIDSTDLPSLHLLALLLSAEKKYHEAVEVLDTAIAEYPTEFSLLQTRVKLAEAHEGAQAALLVCNKALRLWSLLYAGDEVLTEVDSGPAQDSLPRSSSSMKKAASDSKLMDGTMSLKKLALTEATSEVDDDGTGSISASFRIEQSLSATSGTLSSLKMGLSPAIALLTKLWLLTAECYINMGELQEATGCIQEAAMIFPLSPDVLHMRGRLSEATANLTEARACYESALAVLPTHRASLQRVGMLYMEANDLVLAEKSLRDCVLMDASNHTAWSDLGLVLEAVGNSEEAATCLLAALELEASASIMPLTTLPRLLMAQDL